MSTSEIFTLLVRQEETAEKLYQAYNERLPEKELWSQLVKDESTHANWLRALAQEEKAFLNETHFPLQAVKSMLDYEEKLITEAPNHTSVQALSIAYDIEQSLIEKEFFANFKTDSAEVQRVFNDLANETKHHREMIKAELDRLKAQNR